MPTIERTALYASEPATSGLQEVYDLYPAAVLTTEAGGAKPVEIRAHTGGSAADEYFRLRDDAGTVRHAGMTRAGLLGLGGPAAYAIDSRVHVVGESDADVRVQVDAFGSGLAGPTFRGRAARGTPLSPAAVQGEDFLVTVGGHGHDGTAFAEGGWMTLRADATWTATEHGTYWDWELIRTGTTTRLYVASLYTHPSKGTQFELRNKAGHRKGIALMDNGNDAPYFTSNRRWDIFSSELAESGSDAGSDLVIEHFSDAGGSFGNVLYIKRSNGRTGIGDGFSSTFLPQTKLHVLDQDGAASPIVIQRFGANTPIYIGRRASGTFASPSASTNSNALVGMQGQGYDGTAYQNGGLIANAVFSTWSGSSRANYWDFYGTRAAETASIRFASLHDVNDGTWWQIINKAGRYKGVRLTDNTADAGTTRVRWDIASDSTAEGGSDAGSDLVIVRANDAGTTFTTAFSIKRSTGFVGVNLAATSLANQLHVRGSVNDIHAIRVDGVTAVINTIVPVGTFTALTSGDMVDGFGPRISLAAVDSAAVFNILADITAIRDGADNTGTLEFSTNVTGSYTRRMRIRGSNGFFALGRDAANAYVTQFVVSGDSSSGEGNIHVERVAASPAFRLYRLNGAYGAFTAIAAGEQIGRICWNGQYATSASRSTINDIAQIDVISAEAGAFTSSVQGTTMRFFTTAVGASAQVARMHIASTGQVLLSDGTSSLPGLSWISDTDTGIYRQAANAMGLIAGTLEQARLDANATAAETGLLLQIAGTGGVKRVSVGANDSGGTGFRLLRVPN